MLDFGVGMAERSKALCSGLWRVGVPLLTVWSSVREQSLKNSENGGCSRTGALEQGSKPQMPRALVQGSSDSSVTASVYICFLFFCANEFIFTMFHTFRQYFLLK